MKSYIVVRDSNLENLVSRVRILLFDGWEAAGGIAVAVEDNNLMDGIFYLQAMTKGESK